LGSSPQRIRELTLSSPCPTLPCGRRGVFPSQEQGRGGLPSEPAGQWQGLSNPFRLRSLGFGSKSLRKREKEIKAKLEELTNQLGREPTDEELIKALGYKPDEFYSDLQKISAYYLLFLDDPFREGKGSHR